MATEFKVPNMGDNVDSGEVISVLVKEGDSIAQDDSVVELETGKATIEVPSEVAGKITKIHVSSGDTVTPGQVLLTVEEGEGGEDKEADKKQDGPDAQQKAEEPEGSQEEAPSEPSDEDTPDSKADDTQQADREKDRTPADDSDESGAPPNEKKTADRTDKEEEDLQPAPSQGDRIPVAAAPSVRKFAREVGVNISEVPGSGSNGRIQVEDVKAYAKRLLTEPGAPAMAATGSAMRIPPLPDFSQWGEIERQSMNSVRKMTARHMALCWSTIPHVTQQDKADITDLERLRKRYAKKAEQAGGKLTLTAMLLKMVASALKVYPQFNASVDLANEELVVKKYINLGVAVDTPKGLVVPVVQDVDGKNIIELSIELTEMAEKARNGKISPTDMQGGTFTISNLGGIGGSFFTPIINHPEVAILGIGRGAYEPIYLDDQFEARLMLPMSLSYDHRVIDGADGARFLRWIAEAIQEPLLVAMEG